jgi:hypothetical protein
MLDGVKYWNGITLEANEITGEKKIETLRQKVIIRNHLSVIIPVLDQDGVLHKPKLKTDKWLATYYWPLM